MEVGDKGKLDAGKMSEDSVSYQTPNLSSDWRCHNANFANSSMGMVLDGNSMAACKGDQFAPAPMSSMVDSYGAAVWEHSANSQPLGFNGISVRSSDTIGLARGVLGSLRTRSDAGWQELNSALKSGLILPSVSGNIPHLSQLPADSNFIERAARFSCFNSGDVADLMNSFAMDQPLNPQHLLTPMPQGVRAVSGGDPQGNAMNPPSTSKDVSLSAKHRRQEQNSEMKNARCFDEAKQAKSDGAEYGGQEEPSLMDTATKLSKSKGFVPRKRKTCHQDTEHEQSQQLPGEDEKDSGKHSSPPPTVNTTGKNSKQSSPASDPPKEEYIHVRARRGQATNSHSLAERVRRERISERMKFLQDLVPGCSKVTGKAVMLDEIINYVQSLQRQVEFLSMKLATVDPRLDFNIDNLLEKDHMFATRAGASSGFSPNVPMAYPPMHPSQQIVIQPSLPVIGNSSYAMRNLNSQLTSINEGYKEPTQQMPGVWNNELHNIVQMGFSTSATLDNQETNSSLPDDHMKVEP